MSSALTTIRRIILWDYERGTWQYDVLVALIIGTVILVPGSFFGDRDRPMKHTNRPELKSAQANESLRSASKTATQNVTQAGSEPLVITAENLTTFLKQQGKADDLKNNSEAALVLYLREELKREGALERYEVRFDDHREPVSYRVWLK
ncbi:MAG: hypothetical protein U0Z53_15740 [Blastocatellia bacterium]